MGVLLFALLGVLGGIVIITVVELIRCYCPKFRKWLDSEGWDVDV